MQAVIVVPSVAEMPDLEAPVCGIPLLRRVLVTAHRAGVTSILLVLPSDWTLAWLKRVLSWPPLESIFIDAVETTERFEPSNRDHWLAIAGDLDDRFLWIPCRYLPHRAPLVGLLAAAASHPDAAVRFSSSTEPAGTAPGFHQPVVLVASHLTAGVPQHFTTVAPPDVPGVSAKTATRKQVEVELVRRTGKITDGIFSTFNRRLCRPAVRWLSHTSITPNAVSFAGLAVSLVAGLCFAQGAWLWNVVAALLFFFSGLIDEMDGMLARLKFQESPFGCWLETFADYSSYLLIFAGIAIGGYRNGHALYLPAGVALVLGSCLSFAVISIQRKLAAPPDRPNDYSRLYLLALERDSRNPVSRLVRQLQFLTKKGVLIHYLLVFAIIGALPVFFFLTALGANIAWMVTIYFNRRLFSERRIVASRLLLSERSSK